MPGGAGFLPSTGGKSTTNFEKTTTLAGGYEFYIVGLLGKNPAKSSVSLCGEQTK